MKEYIKDTLYNTSGLIIGKNERGSFILGQGEQWIVLDKQDIKNIAYAIRFNERNVFDGFNFTTKKNNIELNQHGHCVSLDRMLFQKHCQCY